MNDDKLIIVCGLIFCLCVIGLLFTIIGMIWCSSFTILIKFFWTFITIGLFAIGITSIFVQ